MTQVLSSMERRHAKEPVYEAVTDQMADDDDSAIESKPSSINYSPHIPGWPTSPQELETKWFKVCSEIALLALPVTFLALATAALYLDKKPISDAGEWLQRAMLLGPTVFPLAFAALGGRSMRNVALWNAERGTTIGVLDTLHGSQSFVSAVGLAISFRSLNLVSFAILVIWALSPLGGQSSLRLLSESNATSTEVSTIYYPNAAGRSYLHQAYPISYINQMSAILSTSMLTADTLWNSSVDIWNHPKIPRLSELERENINNENLGEWKDLAVESYVIYPSLTGIGLFGLEPKTTANLTIPYEYILADCALHMRDPGNKTNEFFKNYKFSNASSPFGASKPYLLPYGWPFNASMADIINPNMTLFGTKYWGPNNAAYYQSSFFLTGLSVYPDAERFVYLGLHDTVPDKGIGVALYKCSLRTVALEANILCRFPECRVHRLRRAAKTVPDEPSPDAEKSPWGVINWNFYFEDFLEYFGTMCGMTTRFSYHPIDNYIYGRTNSSLSYFRNDMIPAHDWSTVPDTQISERLTHILNTYYEASRWLDTTPRNDPHGTFVINSTTGAPYENLKLSNTSATVTREFPIYKASIPWVVTLIVCSTVLLALGIISIVVTLRLSVPDIFGFVSSLTRDNPYIHLPDGGSSLDGEERARLLKDLKVQLGDVREEDKVGYIALRGGVSGQTARTGRVGRGRLYW